MPNFYAQVFCKLSSRAKREICFFSVLILPFLATPFSAWTRPKRPHVTGIDHVRLYVTDIDESHHFYSKLFGLLPEQRNCYGRLYPCFAIRGQEGQKIVLEQAPPGESNFVEEIAIATDDIYEMRRYVVSKGVKATRITKDKYEGYEVDSRFEVRDPEGHSISFFHVYGLPDVHADAPRGVQIIHAGFIVRDREKMERFYKDILGFRPYWHGGMKDDETSWVSLQVPDGSDWLEFMLYDPTGKDKHFLGVMNHIALGVTDIHATQEQLRKNGAPLTEEPKIGRDGKWQLNLYDPDETRIEFMEFTPMQKPCCSEFTAPHPKP